MNETRKLNLDAQTLTKDLEPTHLGSAALGEKPLTEHCGACPLTDGAGKDEHQNMDMIEADF